MKLMILYPMDPFGIKFGGIETYIRSMISYLGKDIDIELIGITLPKILKVGQWHEVNFEGKRIKFFPVCKVRNPNKRTMIPLNFKYPLSLLKWKCKINFHNRLLFFHRIEPAIVLNDIKEKKILFVHGDIRNFSNIFCESKWRYFKWLYFFIESLVISQMKKIFVISRAGCEFYRNKYPKYSSRFQFLPVWFEPKIFFRMRNINKNGILNFLRIPLEKKIILYVGRLEKPKDPLLLLETFSLVKKLLPETVLLIIGEGNLKNETIKKIRDLNFSQSVFFLGEKTQMEIAKIMNISDVFLLTSAFEGMPMVVLEALACGLPVVTTNVGEVTLVVKDGISGKVVNSRKPEDIAMAVVKIINNPPPLQKILQSYSSYGAENVIKYILEQSRRVFCEQV